jgi:hypothetical protein
VVEFGDDVDHGRDEGEVQTDASAAGQIENASLVEAGNRN